MQRGTTKPKYMLQEGKGAGAKGANSLKAEGTKKYGVNAVKKKYPQGQGGPHPEKKGKKKGVEQKKQS